MSSGRVGQVLCRTERGEGEARRYRPMGKFHVLGFWIRWYKMKVAGN